MTYVRKRKTNRYKKKVYKKPMRYEVADMALKAYNGVMAVKKLINVEIKKHDFNFSGSAITATGNVTNLALVPQGDGYQNRDGLSLKPQYFKARLYVFNDGSYPDTSIIRLILLRARNENGTAPAVTDILETADPFALYNFTEKARFRILSDKMITITPQKTGEVQSKLVGYSLPIDQHIHFENGSTNSENGGLYLIQISNRGTLYPQLTGNCRLTFTDN